MKSYIQSTLGENTPIVQLRHYLNETEQQIVVMYETPDGTVTVIRNIDQIVRLLAALRGPQFDTRAEEGRADGLRERLRHEGRKVVGHIQSNAHSEQLSDSPTWRDLLAALQQQRSRQRQRWLIGAGMAIVLAIVL